MINRSPRFYVEHVLKVGELFLLPPDVVRHVQVLRLSTEQSITLFHAGVEYRCQIHSMGKKEIQVNVLIQEEINRENKVMVHLACVMPANERMDWLIEKATELGASSIQPLMSERSVLRLSRERALKKLHHWNGIATASCEQCGRNVIPQIFPARNFLDWLTSDDLCLGAAQPGYLLSLVQDSRLLSERIRALKPVTEAIEALTILTGPEGGFSQKEEQQALAAGFRSANLGRRVLRAETAALAALVTAAE